MASGIYWVRNIKTNKRYIGSDVNVSSRFNEHRYRLRKNIHPNQHLQNAWNKDGERNFEFKLLVECNHDCLIRFEQMWIDRFWDKGLLYNIRRYAQSNLGIKHSEQTKERLRVALDYARSCRVGNYHYHSESARESHRQNGRNLVESNSKEWLIIHPCGKEETIKNLREFCRQYKLDQGAMWKVSRGLATHHKQFKVRLTSS